MQGEGGSTRCCGTWIALWSLSRDSKETTETSISRKFPRVGRFHESNRILRMGNAGKKMAGQLQSRRFIVNATTLGVRE
jgi:hypothetical protein